MRKLLPVLFLFTINSLSAQFAQLRRLDSGSDSVQKWETVENGMRIPQLENTYRTFLTDNSRGVNPYAAHNMWIQFTHNSTNYYSQVFYMDEAQADDSLNTYIAVRSSWPWRARFAVPDTGEWSALLLVGDDKAHAVPQNTSITFRCVNGTSHGFLHIADDHRTLEFSDGTPYFIIGQNIAFTSAPILKGYYGKFPQYISGYYDIYHDINDLADNRGNFFRIVMAPWSTGIEWQQTGIYDQAHAWALDSMVKVAARRGLHMQIAIDISLSFDGIKGADAEHPYMTSFIRPGMKAIDLLTDSAALAAFDNYFRYVYSRWLYSPNVCDIEMCCEENHWEGFEGNEKKVDAFFLHIKQLMKTEFGDSTHLLSMSELEGNASSRFGSDAFDYVDVHQYTNDFVANERRYKLVNKRSIRSMDKPFLFGEMGMCNGPVNACDANDFEYCSDISFHNALWATAFMGCMGTGLEWWQWENDSMRKNNFPALEYFVDTVVGNITAYHDHEMWTGNDLETFYSKNNNMVVGWVHNRSYWWANTSDTCKDRDGKMMIHPTDDDKTDVPVKTSGNMFVVSNLRRNTGYTVYFYDTQEKGKLIKYIDLKTNVFGKLKIPMPNNTDCAYTIEFKPIRDF